MVERDFPLVSKELQYMDRSFDSVMQQRQEEAAMSYAERAMLKCEEEMKHAKQQLNTRVHHSNISDYVASVTDDKIEAEMPVYRTLKETVYTREEKGDINLTNEIKPTTPTIDLDKICDDLALNHQLPSPKLIEMKEREAEDAEFEAGKQKILAAVKKNKTVPCRVDDLRVNNSNNRLTERLNGWLRPQGYEIGWNYYAYTGWGLYYYTPSAVWKWAKRGVVLVIGAAIARGLWTGIGSLIGYLTQ